MEHIPSVVECKHFKCVGTEARSKFGLGRIERLANLPSSGAAEVRIQRDLPRLPLLFLQQLGGSAKTQNCWFILCR